MTTAKAYSNYQYRLAAYRSRKNTAAARFAPPVRANRGTFLGAVLTAWDYLTRI